MSQKPPEENGPSPLKNGIVENLGQDYLLTIYVRSQGPIPRPSLKTTFSLVFSLPQPDFSDSF